MRGNVPREDTMRKIRLLAAVAALAVCASCAHTYIKSNPGDACGEFRSTSTVVPEIFTTPGGQYAQYRGACAQYETVRTLAVARNASVQAAYAAAGAVRGKGAYATKRDLAILALEVACRDGHKESCEKLAAATQQGGAR